MLKILKIGTSWQNLWQSEEFRSDVRHELWRNIVVPVLAIIFALGVGALILSATGYNVVKAYGALWQGVFGSKVNVGEAFLRSTPLILIGTGIALAFRCGFWNIGAEGQFYAGAAAGTYVALTFANLPPWAGIPIALLVGFFTGAIWGALAGLLKVKFCLNEVVTTIMLNYIAIGLVGYLVTGPMQEAMRENPQTDEIVRSFVIGRIFPTSRVHYGFIIAVVVAIIATIVLFRTPLGYSMRAVGYNPDAAKHAGINVASSMATAAFLSGGTAGLAGAIEVLGVTGRLFENLSPGYGFEGIAVSLLVNNHPLATIVSGLLFGALGAGSQVMQLNAKVPAVLTFIIQGLIIAFIISFRYLDKNPSGK